MARVKSHMPLIADFHKIFTGTNCDAVNQSLKTFCISENTIYINIVIHVYLCFSEIYKCKVKKIHEDTGF